MILLLGDHEKAFKKMKISGVQQACSALIFVSNECDSLCTLRILTVRIRLLPHLDTNSRF
jgi:hypothetical protein